MVKYQIYQIASLIKVSILKATHRDAECTVEGVDVAIEGAEVEAAGTGTTYTTTPIVAGAAYIAKAAITAVAVARRGHVQLSVLNCTQETVNFII